MRWDRALLDKAVGLGARVAVSDETLASAGVDGEKLTKDQLVHELVAAGEAAGLMIDARDIAVSVIPERQTFSTSFGARWRPDGRPAQLVGGPNDGQEHRVDVWKSWPFVELMTPGLPQSLITAVDPAATPATATLPVYHYTLDGWDETTRAWLMGYAGER